MNTSNFFKRFIVRICLSSFVVLCLLSLGAKLRRFDLTDNRVVKDDETLDPHWQSQEQRKAAIERYCKQRTAPMSVEINYGDDFLYNDQHRVVYCRVPKVACSTWKRVLLIFEGVQKTLFEIPNSKIHGYRYKYLQELNTTEIKRLKESYYSFIFTRHPHDRLFSAYRNKFLDPKGRYGFIEVFSPWMVYDHIKDKKTMNAHLARHHNGNRRLNVSFTQFVKYVLNHRPNYDPHWQLQTDIGKICDYKFNHIGKFETMKRDAKIIFDDLNVSHIYAMFGDDTVYTQKTTTMLEKHYSQLPADMLRGIYERYKGDFDAFGYDPNFYFKWNFN